MITYSIDDYINSVINKDWLTIIDITEKEVRKVDAIWLKTNQKKPNYYQIRRYRELVGDFLFFLNCRIVPAGIGKEGLKKFEPVIKSLVDQGCFLPAVLDLLKD
jgi:hypothetical protein